MAKESYTLAHVSITYAPFGAASFDCKNGIAESGCTIAMSEDFGERVKGETAPPCGRSTARRTARSRST